MTAARRSASRWMPIVAALLMAAPGRAWAAGPAAPAASPGRSSLATAPPAGGAPATRSAAATVIGKLTVDPPAFSPRAIAAPRAATITFVLSSKSKVVAQIVAGKGRVVRTLLDVSAAAPKTYALRWNGTASNGVRAPDGVYRVRVVTSRGKKHSTTYAAVVLDATAPRLAALGAAPNPFWPYGTASSKLVVSVRVVGERARLTTTVRGTGGVSVRWTDVTSGTVTHSWDGMVGARRVGFGSLQLRTVARDAVGNESSLSRVVLVSPYSDLAGLDSAIRDAILQAVKRHVAVARGGLFSGKSDGSFKPGAGASRADLAAVLVRAFATSATSSTAARSFSDVPNGSSLENAASVVVAKGWMDDYAASGGRRAFHPQEPATTAQLARALTRALGMRATAEKIAAQDPSTPWWGGDTVVMQDLGLRRHGALQHPSAGYARGELAYTIVAAQDIGSADKTRVADEFAASGPIAQSARQRQFTLGARRFLGEPYVWGGDTLSAGGFDCSGLVYHVAGALGVSLARTAAEQFADSRFGLVAFASLQPADGIYFRSSTGGGRISHAGMYLGNGYFIHSSGSRNGVSIDRLTPGSYWRDHLAGGRRYIPAVQLKSPSISPLQFSPNGDGTRDAVAISFRTTKVATLTVAVDNASGLRVRTLMSARKPAGPYSLSWNGAASSAVAVDGRYLVRISAVDDETNRRSYSAWVTLDTSAPALDSPTMSPDPYVSSNATATFSVRPSEPCDVTLVVQRADGAAVYRATATADAAATVRFLWNGRGAGGVVAPAGDYRYRFTAIDLAGNAAGTDYKNFSIR